MYEGEILRQVREAREALARRFNYDVRALGEYLRSLNADGNESNARRSAGQESEPVAGEPSRMSHDNGR